MRHTLLMLNGSEYGNIVDIDWSLYAEEPPILIKMSFINWYEKYFTEIIKGENVIITVYFRQ